MIPPVADIHTHNLLATNAVINLPAGMTELRPDALYSVGIHPWWTAAERPTMQWVEQMARHPQVVMIGECGIDRRRGCGTVEEQTALLCRHVELSEQLRKPLILHIVGAWNEIIALRRRLRPTQPWIIHGFRGKPQLAQQLLDADFHISIGPRFNPATAALIPPSRLLHETD
jgi:TatD DNase family protein